LDDDARQYHGQNLIWIVHKAESGWIDPVINGFGNWREKKWWTYVEVLAELQWMASLMTVLDWKRADVRKDLCENEENGSEGNIRLEMVKISVGGWVEAEEMTKPSGARGETRIWCWRQKAGSEMKKHPAEFKHLRHLL
jgi:hypothetical protein